MSLPIVLPLHGRAMQAMKNAHGTFGRAADQRKTSRTIPAGMNDNMRFALAKLSVKEEDVIKFMAFNRDAAMMRMLSEMEHGKPCMAHVAPGKMEMRAWHFNQAGPFEYGCLIPGYFEAGMAGKIKVRAASTSAAR